MSFDQPETVPDDGPAAASHDALRLDQQVCFPLYAAANLVTRAYGPLLRAIGLTYPQYLVMMVLWEEGRCGVGRIGERLYLDSGTLSPLIKRLETAGLVARRRSETDERQVQVELTAAGRALQAEAAAIPQSLFCRLDVPLDRLLGLRAELQDLLRRLDGNELPPTASNEKRTSP